MGWSVLVIRSPSWQHLNRAQTCNNAARSRRCKQNEVIASEAVSVGASTLRLSRVERIDGNGCEERRKWRRHLASEGGCALQTAVHDCMHGRSEPETWRSIGHRLASPQVLAVKPGGWDIRLRHETCCASRKGPCQCQCQWRSVFAAANFGILLQGNVALRVNSQPPFWNDQDIKSLLR